MVDIDGWDAYLDKMAEAYYENENVLKCADDNDTEDYFD